MCQKDGQTSDGLSFQHSGTCFALFVEWDPGSKQAHAYCMLSARIVQTLGWGRGGTQLPDSKTQGEWSPLIIKNTCKISAYIAYESHFLY